MTIKQISALSGLSPYTLRYYEHIGLIINVDRNANGQRCYSEKDLLWIEFLLRLKETGMPISEMQKFALLRSHGDTTAKERRQLLETHKTRVKKQLEQFQLNLKKISTKIAFYKEIEAAQKNS
jgi:DNA-binding transcriptional MerR regulator